MPRDLATQGPVEGLAQGGNPNSMLTAGAQEKAEEVGLLPEVGGKLGRVFPDYFCFLNKKRSPAMND